jgi:hypothetical protein
VKNKCKRFRLLGKPLLFFTFSFFSKTFAMVPSHLKNWHLSCENPFKRCGKQRRLVTVERRLHDNDGFDGFDAFAMVPSHLKNWQDTAAFSADDNGITLESIESIESKSLKKKKK